MTEPPPKTCPVCAVPANRKCSRCKIVSYCSEACQKSHWQSEHKTKCSKADSKQSSTTYRTKRSSAISLVPSARSYNNLNQSKKILFPYEEFIQLFNWDNPGFPPCGLLNCGNSCFANVVLQCLTYTKPLVAYLLEKSHRRECMRNDWCFLCEFQTHLEKASRSQQPFSPINILSRLPNIGGNLGYGSQEDAHELMRFAIDTMQSVCLDEFGGEKVVHPSSQETTLIQHIFGGHLQSQVICTKCDSVSNQLENMMDLTVEIQGDAASLEECLDQFTAKEKLHGENMYKCDKCNDYVTAWKRLTIETPPNILTIALKRFQSGRFGKLNKRVGFPEMLDLSPYMSKKGGDDEDLYKLYAVIVHVDMLNASFFGHYICYIKDFRGDWYRVDDCKVSRVDLYDVLWQGAYMLLYTRLRPRPSSLYPLECRGVKEMKKKEEELEQPKPKLKVQCPTNSESHVDKEEEKEKEDICGVTNSEDVEMVDSSLTTANSNMEVEQSDKIITSNCNGHSSDKDSSSLIRSSVEIPCSNGTISKSPLSGPKLKPLFPAGFLVKQVKIHKENGTTKFPKPGSGYEDQQPSEPIHISAPAPTIDGKKVEKKLLLAEEMQSSMADHVVN